MNMLTGIADRKVKIVVTLGPATSTPDRVSRLIQAGANVFRLNFSHGSHEEHAQLFAAVRQAAGDLDRHVAVLQDLQGPKIRVVGVQEGKPMKLVPGQELVISGQPAGNDPRTLCINYPRLHLVVSPGSRILLDDGRMELRVADVVGDRIVCQVITGGLLEANKGVNLPGAPLDVPAFTEKDRADLEFGLGLGVDWVALSFVRHGDDVRPVQETMARTGVRVPVLAKIERPEALENLHTILRAFDGVMVARGDLGIELPPEEVPVWQKKIIHQARGMGKVSIVATQMLESMITSPRPTRAEVSDVANAVFDGTDAEMLSGETSVGAYPTESVSLMSRVIRNAEAVYSPAELEEGERLSSAGAVAHAACVMARDLHSQALVVLTQSGMSARFVSTRRASAPIIAFTDRAEMVRQLVLWWGINPVLMDFPTHTEEAISRVEAALLQTGAAKPGEEVIVVGSTPLASKGPTNFLKVHRIRPIR